MQASAKFDNKLQFPITRKWVTSIIVHFYH